MIDHGPDERLRRLERAAQGGDPEAAQEAARMRERAGALAGALDYADCRAESPCGLPCQLLASEGLHWDHLGDAPGYGEPEHALHYYQARPDHGGDVVRWGEDSDEPLDVVPT